jgi:endonuclease/exonuclease/phosphatase family metal-dependent hydrolase
MRFVTWNMGCGFGGAYKPAHLEAWAETEALDPDVALLQEVMSVPESVDPSRVVGAPQYPGGRFHTIVYVRRGSVRLAEADAVLAPVLGGQAVIAEVSDSSGGPVVLASVHVRTGVPSWESLLLFDALPDELRNRLPPNQGLWNPTVVVNAIAGRVRGRRFVIGGDFNTAWRFDETQGNATGYWASEQFRAIRDRGWRRCHLKFHAGEERTLFRRPNAIYQLHHFFADDDTYRAASRCDVVHLENLERLSDHAPVILEIETPAK